ncbi:MAG: hypothetical protein JXA66_05595, partial [Oligoflexia bacterium]|nr:hypothetical protein [Oligoflexia bacterium]
GEIESLIGRIDSLLLDWEALGAKIENLFELRRLIFQLDDIVNVQMIMKYNEILGTERMERISSGRNSGTQSDYLDASAVNNKDTGDSGLNSPADVWQGVSSYLMDNLNIHTYNVWVKPVRFHSCENKHIKIMVENQFYKNWLEDHCSKLIRSYLDDTNSGYEVSFITN